MFFCEKCRIENDWPGFVPSSRGRCEVCDAFASCYDVPATKLPLGVKVPETPASDEPLLVKLYAHEEYEGFTPEDILDEGTDAEFRAVQELLDERPLYEVEFVFDAMAKTCLHVNLSGVIYTPKESA